MQISEKKKKPFGFRKYDNIVCRYNELVFTRKITYDKRKQSRIYYLGTYLSIPKLPSPRLARSRNKTL